MTECFILLRLRALEKYLNGAILHVLTFTYVALTGAEFTIKHKR